MEYYIKKFSGMGALVIPRRKGIEVYPLPFAEKKFFDYRKLAEGFFILKQIPGETFDAIMKLRDGTCDVPREALNERVKNMKLLLGIGGVECL